MANLALCIPYDKWEFVLGQVRRVLTPGGRLELIDDDIYFPYGDGSKGVEFEALVPASPLCGGERLDVGDNETERGEDTVDGDSMKPEAANETTVSTPVVSDSKFVDLRQAPRTPHCFFSKNSSLLPASPHDSLLDTSSIPDSTSRYEKTDLKSTISPRPNSDRRQCSGSKTFSRSATRHLVPPSPTMRKDGKLGNSSPPYPKRIKEKVALLPPIRSITPTFSLSSGSKYFPTWSLRTANTSPTRSEASSIRSTDTSPSTSVSSVVNPGNPVWQKKIFASRNMESLFEKMLVEQYGIHPRPSEFILRVFGKVFHEIGDDEARVRMTKNFHIKLAPAETISDHPDSGHVGGTEKGHGSMEKATMEEVEGMALTRTGMSSTFSTFDVNSKPQNRIPVTSLKSRPWQGQDKKLKVDRPRGKKDKDKDKQNKSKLEEQDGRQFKPQQTQAGTMKTTATMTVSLFKRPQPQDIALSTPVSPALSAKAAGILGIPYSELSTVTMSLSLSSKKRRSPVVPLTWSFPSNLSAKAAGRLGITYSEALSAAASLSVPAPVPSSSSTFSPTTSSEPELSSNTTSGPVQHSGLFIWPSAYVPMAPGELEMHACKYIHTLLGCRPALEEFVANFVDGRGDRLIGEEELRDEIWEYEWSVFVLSPEFGS